MPRNAEREPGISVSRRKEEKKKSLDIFEPLIKEQNEASRYAAVFALTAHGLARKLHQSNAEKAKALNPIRSPL